MITAGLLCLGFIVHVAQAIPSPGHGALAGYCLTSRDCKDDECCVSFIQPRRKRLFLSELSPELEQLVNGKCVKRGIDSPTDYCVLEGAKPDLSGLYYHCPCMSGYTCTGTGRMALPDGEIGRCSKNTTKRFVSAKSCFNGTDCASNECCQSDFQPIGKRRQFTGTVHGHCQPLGTSSSGCLVKMGSGKPAGVVYRCPCAPGYTCHGTGLVEVPLGETGTCGV